MNYFPIMSNRFKKTLLSGTIEDEIENIFKILEEGFHPQITNQGQKFPKINMYEDDSSYIIEIALSGINSKDVNLFYDEKTGHLDISYEKKSDDTTTTDTNEFKCLIREISNKNFRRKISFFKPIDPDTFNAEHDKETGIIKLSVKKKQDTDNNIKKEIKITQRK
jgi:HSP20 family molecular chaperone IbpA